MRQPVPKMTMSAVRVSGSGLVGESMVRVYWDGDVDGIVGGGVGTWAISTTVPLMSLILLDWTSSRKEVVPGKRVLKMIGTPHGIRSNETMKQNGDPRFAPHEINIRPHIAHLTPFLQPLTPILEYLRSRRQRSPEYQTSEEGRVEDVSKEGGDGAAGVVCRWVRE